MKKNKQTNAQRAAAIKRGKKRSDRLKKTQKDKHLRRAVLVADRKAKDKKFKEAMEKLMQAKMAR